MIVHTRVSFCGLAFQLLVLFSTQLLILTTQAMPQTPVTALTTCKTRPEYRAFDFFVGEWEQQNRVGRVVGTGSVKLPLDGCVIEETTVNPQTSYTGHAFHYFDPALGKWRQTYVDTKAELHCGQENSKTARYVTPARSSHANASKSMGRSIFTRIDADRVRQLFEVSTDDGKTWTTGWDGFYVRKRANNSSK